jgi:hypothetical protein
MKPPLRHVYYWGAPLAALAAVVLLASLRVSQLPLYFARAGAVAAARSRLQSWGVDASSWRVLLKLESQNGPYLLHRTTPVPAGSLAPRLAPPYVIHYSLTPAGSGESVEMILSPRGDLLRLKIPSALALIRLKPPEAIARWRAEWPGLAASAGKEDFLFLPDPAIPELRYELSARAGSSLEELNLAAVVPPAVASPAKLQDGLRNGLVGASGFLHFLLLLYAIRRYFKRRREQEVPSARALLLLLSVIALGAASFAVNFDQLIQFSDFDAAALGKIVAVAIGGVVGIVLSGFMLAAAYGGGEGELREAFPGKLTSLDAVLSGRWLSRNAARSGFHGLAFASWSLLLLAAGLLALRQPLEADLKEAGSFLLSRFPWASLLLHIPMEVVEFLVVSLLIPLTFVLRNIRRRWLAVTVLLLVAWISLAAVTNVGNVRPGPLLLSALSGFTLLGAFWFHDLLGAIVALGVFRLVAVALSLAAFDPLGRPLAFVSLAVAAAILLALLLLARRGPSVTEQEVSPQYARNLAQRLALRSEFSAAREAQLRLLPAAPPSIPGILWSAACHAAGQVGGDFYDFFPLSRGRLAILMASGSGAGLASAMLIGFAKGFLGCYLARQEDPVAALARLRQTLPEIIGSTVRIDLALLVLDPAASTLAAARLGDFPLFWIEGPAGVASIELYTGPGDVATAHRSLDPADQVILHSRGVVALLEDQSVTGRSAWFQQLASRSPAPTPAARLESLLDRLGANKKNWTRRLHHDVTVLVARLEAASSTGRERVA